MLVAVVCCTVFIFQNVVAIPFYSEGDEVQTTDSIEKSEYLSINGTAEIGGMNFDVALRLSMPLMALRVDSNLAGNEFLFKIKYFTILGNKKMTRLYTTWFGDEVCHFKSESNTEETTTASETSITSLLFEGVELVNGEEVEKWVSDVVEVYVKQTEEGEVPVRVVFPINEKLAISIDVKEFSEEPIPDDVFDYDSSFPCKELESSSVHGTFGSTEVSSRLRAFVKRSA